MRSVSTDAAPSVERARRHPEPGEPLGRVQLQDRAGAGPMMLTYSKTVVGRSADEFEVNPANFAAYRPSFIKDACSNAGVRNLLNSGIAVRNLTRDMHGVLIYELTVRSADCAR